MGRGRTKGTITNVKFDPERLTNARILNGIKTDQEIVNALRSRGITESTLSNARYHKNINKDVLRIIAQYLNVGIHYLSGFELETFDEVLADEFEANGYTSEDPPSLEIIRTCEDNVRKHNRFDKDGYFVPEYDYSLDKEPTIEAIPIDWILNNERMPKDGKGRDAILDMIEDWRKENADDSD